MNIQYDSEEDTNAHINRVRELIDISCGNLYRRSNEHDRSKLLSPEKEAFDEYTPKLKDSTYGSDEYKSFLAGLKPALDHHYANNSHHPEHYGVLICDQCFTEHPKDHEGQCKICGSGWLKLEPNIGGMSLFDLVEMLCDWKAAGERHTDGSMERSLRINKDRFKISPQLQSILENTVKELRWI